MPDEITQTPRSPLLRYRTWYLRVGRASVYLVGDYNAYLRQPLHKDTSGHQRTGRHWARNILLSVKAATHAVKLLRKTGWWMVGWNKLHEHTPVVEDAGQDGRLISMLHDTRENIDWRSIDCVEPDAPAVFTQDMPSPPRTDADWDYYN